MLSPLLHREKARLCVCVLWVKSKGKCKMETIYEFGACIEQLKEWQAESTTLAFMLSPVAV